MSMSGQVEKCEILGRYYKTYSWNNGEETYLKTGSGWQDINFTIRRDYYIVTFGDKGPVKVWWNFDKSMSESSSTPVEIYFTKDGRKVIFKYEDQSITFFDEWDVDLGRYLNATVIEKTSKVTDTEPVKTNIERPF